MLTASVNDKHKQLDIGSTNHRVIRAPLDSLVVKVLIQDGMKVEKDQPMFVLAAYPIQMTLPTLPIPEWHKSQIKMFFNEESSRAGKFPLEDVFLDWNAENSRMAPTLDSLVNVRTSHEYFKKFDVVVDHSDHLFVAHNSSILKNLLPGYWDDKLRRDWRTLSGHLPDTMFVRTYNSRQDLLRAAIVGPEGTPYCNGLFFFDFCFPLSYPNTPPLVRYHSGGLGISPYLRACGEVKLTLSNVTSGLEDIWVPGTSTVLQVLVYIQDLIFNSNPMYTAPLFKDIKGTLIDRACSLLYNENAIINTLKTMVYTMNYPPKNFENLVAGHFCKRAGDILLACKDYMSGCQVGSLVSSSKCSYSIEFRNDVAASIKPLVNAFCTIGSEEALDFLYLSEMEIPLPENEPTPDSDCVRRLHVPPPCMITADFPFQVDMVPVKDGMNVRKGDPLLFFCKLDMKELALALSSTATKPEIMIKEILKENWSARVGIFSMEDVLIDEDDAAASSPTSVPYNHDAAEYRLISGPCNYDAHFHFVCDHSDHSFAFERFAMSEVLSEKISYELIYLERHLPGTQIYVASYADRRDLLRAVIVGPEGTPYHNGLFVFDVCFPSTYPSRPPLVHYRSGGLGVNPNLNKSGKVRLSLPILCGRGQRDLWARGSSNVFGLLVCLKNQILNREPLFNDVTYICMKGSPYGQQSSMLYNENVFIKSLKTIVYTINKPPKHFEDIVVRHFRDHVHDILMSCTKETYSITAKNDLAFCMNRLIAAFKKIGAIEAEQYCLLAKHMSS